MPVKVSVIPLPVGSPACLPQQLPSAAQIALIFLDFRDNYRRFESRHLRRRHEVLKQRHEKSRELLFHGLRNAPAGQVDSLTVHRTYTVLEVDSGGRQAMLDPPLDSRGHSTWKLNNEPAEVSIIADVTCNNFEGAICPVPGDEVEQVQWLASHKDLVDEFLALWHANGFRPICLMSMIYRTWSGLRARFLLRKLAVFTQYQAHGFLPGHEAAQVGYYTQALVELACQGDFDLVGMSCDLVKAFNNLPRDPLFQAASIIGIPEALTRPWAQFLAKFERRFLIRRHVGESVLSACGFPQGCPLSTAAMAITDLVFHAYMTVFSPRVSSFSFVDNLGFTASDPGSLAQGYNTAQCFVDLLGLELDREKTYVWSVKASQRKQLQLMGLSVLEHARDLGSLMSYGRSVRNATLRTRMQELGPPDCL